MTKHTRKVEEVFFKAHDGKEFKTTLECEMYEWELEAIPCYVLTHKYSSKIGLRTPEIYSTKALAEKAIGLYPNSEDWEVQEVLQDVRFWKEKK